MLKFTRHPPPDASSQGILLWGREIVWATDTSSSLLGVVYHYFVLNARKKCEIPISQPTPPVSPPAAQVSDISLRSAGTAPPCYRPTAHPYSVNHLL